MGLEHELRPAKIPQAGLAVENSKKKGVRDQMRIG